MHNNNEIISDIGSCKQQQTGSAQANSAFHPCGVGK